MSGRPGPETKRFTGFTDIRLVVHQLGYEQLAFWVNKVGALFTVGFSVVFLILLGASAGASRIAYLGNIKLVQYYVAGFIAYGVMGACFNNLAINLVVRRETGLLKRLRLSPMPTWVLLAAVFLSTTITALVQVVLLLGIGRIGYGVHLPRSWPAFLIALVVGVASFVAMGVAMSTAIPNQESAGPVVSVIFFVLLFLSGLWFPLKAHSGLTKFANFFPVHHLIAAIFAPFEFIPGSSPWAWHDLLIVAIWGAASTVIALRRFRWAPRRT